MGKRGPPRLPTEVLRARGSDLVRDREAALDANAENLEAARGELLEPDALVGVGLELWRVLVPTLEGMGILTTLDAQTVERYCRLYGRWRRLEAAIEEHGDTFEVYEVKNGVREFKAVRARPEVRLAAELSTQLTRLERELGLSPASRASILSDALGGGIGKREAASPAKEGTVVDAKEMLLA